MRLTVVGLVIGLPVALLLGRFASAMLYEVSPYDPATLAGVMLVFLAVSAFASFLPRGARIAYRSSCGPAFGVGAHTSPRRDGRPRRNLVRDPNLLLRDDASAYRVHSMSETMGG